MEQIQEEKVRKDRSNIRREVRKDGLNITRAG